MEPLSKAKTRSTLILDPEDPTDAILSRYAGRIGMLLRVPTVKANPDLAGSLDDFVGAVMP